jgi:ketosteroid isomerase-like protein
MTGQIDAFLSEWTMAEQAGDTTILDQQLTADFYGVGPLGFILPRAAWLARHGQGDLAYAAFSLEEQQSRVLGSVAVVTARNNTRGTYRGRPIPEAARATLVLTRDAGGWKLAVIHMSFIAGTQGAPLLPGPASQTGPGAPR